MFPHQYHSGSHQNVLDKLRTNIKWLSLTTEGNHMFLVGVINIFGFMSCSFATSLLGGLLDNDKFEQLIYPKLIVFLSEGIFCDYYKQTVQLFASSIYISAIFGALLATWLCTKAAGRHWWLVAAFSPISLALGVVYFFVAHLWMIVMGRILMGIGVGFSQVIVYLNDQFEGSRRAGLSICMILGDFFGIIYANSTNIRISNSTVGRWQMMWVMSVPLSLYYMLCLLVYRFLPLPSGDLVIRFREMFRSKPVYIDCCLQVFREISGMDPFVQYAHVLLEPMNLTISSAIDADTACPLFINSVIGLSTLVSSCVKNRGIRAYMVWLSVLVACILMVFSSISALESASASKSVSGPDFSLLLSKILQSHFFVSPEVLLELLHREGMDVETDELRHTISDRSDSWSLGCLLLSLIVGDQFIEELATHLPLILRPAWEECDLDYSGLAGKLTSLLETKIGSKHVHLQQILCSCLHFKPKDRPPVSHVWKCMRGLIINPEDDLFVSLEGEILEKKTLCCLVLSQLFEQPKKSIKGLETHILEPKDVNGVAKADPFRSLSADNLKVMDMSGHHDCITGLAVSGGFLFSSSFDKTIHVWSLQDFTLVRSFIGHEQRVMAVVSFDEQQPFCISGDSGGGIFLWSINAPLGDELIKKWYEPKDWRYSGIHALIVSESQYLYTGSGDRLIKAWSLQDYTLSCTMSGHNSVVSSLAACEGILYSGSWDGTIRLWSLNDHSSLAVLEKETPGNIASVLCLAADRHMLVVAHENGHLKIWKNDMVMRSMQVHDGAIFAVGLEGKWLFTGGWDKTVNVQELLGDDCQIDVIPIVSLASENVITALSYWRGNLYVGLADGLIKVHCYGE